MGRPGDGEADTSNAGGGPPSARPLTEAGQKIADRAAADKAVQDKKDETDKRSATDPTFLNGGTAVAVFFGLVYWITTATLPLPGQTGNPSPWLIALFAAIAVFGLTLTIMSRGKGNISRLQTICLVAYVLTLDWLLISAYFSLVQYTPAVKFALSVGGLAIAAFIYGVIAFDTIRAAASLPIVVLFIGLAIAPSDFTFDPEVKKQLILWMGIILGANAAGEAVSQTAKVVSAGKVTSVVAGSDASPADAGEKQRLLTNGITTIGGDLAPSTPQEGR